MISLRQHNARNNRFGQTFAEAWWAWLTITEFHCGFSSTVFFTPPRSAHLFACYCGWRAGICWGREGQRSSYELESKNCFFSPCSQVFFFFFLHAKHTHSTQTHTHLCVCNCSGDSRRSDLPERSVFCLRYNHKSSPGQIGHVAQATGARNHVRASRMRSVFRLCQLLFIEAKQRLACVASRPTYSESPGLFRQRGFISQGVKNADPGPFLSRVTPKREKKDQKVEKTPGGRYFGTLCWCLPKKDACH